MKTLRTLCLVAAASLLFASANTARAAFSTIITFDELSERPLDGVSLKGVTFHFNGSNSFFPQGLFGTTQLSYGETTLMSAPWAAGSSDGELSIDFSVPVVALSFDAGLTTTAPLPDGYQVRLF